MKRPDPAEHSSTAYRAMMERYADSLKAALESILCLCAEGMEIQSHSFLLRKTIQIAGDALKGEE